MRDLEKRLLTATALYGANTATSFGAIVHIDNAPVSVPTTSDATVPWDIDQDSTADENIKRFAAFDAVQFSLNGDNLNGFVRANGDSNREFRNLANGFSVKATMTGYNFNPSNQVNMTAFIGNGNPAFSKAQGFTDNVEGNVGFRFNISGSTHYGWAKITMDIGQEPGTLTISEWAYNDVAGGAIQVGAVPEPAGTTATLALICAGAAGFRRWRQNKRATETVD